MDETLRLKVSKAVSKFWRVRLAQSRRQGAAGEKDRGSRAAVTGGRQLDGFVQLVCDLLCESGLCREDVHIERRRTTLPGFFRPTKEWDILAIVDGKLLATIEFKSQVGPSFGNNFNNRTEQAVGSDHDFWTAFREGAFAGSPRPWLGFMMLLEASPASMRSVSVEEPHFPVFPEFSDSSYAKRYQLLCMRLVRERLYDSACLLMSDADGGRLGAFSTPSEEVSISRFAASLASHAAAYARFGK